MRNIKRLSVLSSFTLVELMIAVSILAIGIVLIVRGLVTNASALGTSENKIEAIRFLAFKMAELEEKAVREDGVSSSHTRAQVTINGRKATFIQEIAPLEAEGLRDELNEVKLMLLWKEGRVSKDASLASYFENKK